MLFFFCSDIAIIAVRDHNYLIFIAGADSTVSKILKHYLSCRLKRAPELASGGVNVHLLFQNCALYVSPQIILQSLVIIYCPVTHGIKIYSLGTRTRISGLLAQLTRWSIMFIREQVRIKVFLNGLFPASFFFIFLFSTQLKYS